MQIDVRAAFLLRVFNLQSEIANLKSF